MASIIPYEIVAWEKLFWFLKFLIPKLLASDPAFKAAMQQSLQQMIV
jgi:type I restriction enzyme R subunit